jgi:hypothetical protein
MNYQKPAVEIPPVNFDQSQSQDFSKRIQPHLSTLSNKPKTSPHTKYLDRLDFCTLRPINSLASE